MMLKEDIQEKYIKIRKALVEIDSKEDPSQMEFIFRHEIGNVIHQVLIAEEMYKENKNFIDQLLPSIYQRIEQAYTILPITKISEMSKNTLTTNSPLDLYNIITDISNPLSKQYKTPIKITGNIYPKLEEFALKALISTNIGDAFKWSPKNPPIEVKMNERENDLELIIKNHFSTNPANPEIGLNQGIGTKYTNTYLNAIGGKVITKPEGEIFQKNIYFPKN